MSISKKTAIITGAAIIIASAGIIRVSSAAGTSSTRMSNLVNAIASKFNLNPNDVQQVVDQTLQQERSQRQAQFLQNYTTRINQAVQNGQLTQDQANKILAKEQEVQNFLNSLSGKTAQERQSAVQQELTSLQQWAQDNNIPQQYLPIGFAMKGHMRGGFGMMGQHPAAVGTVTGVSGNSITITDGNNTTYTVDASKATITKLTPGTNGAAPTQATVAVSQIQTGDKLAVVGTLSGNTISATQITDGVFGRMGMGAGMGRWMMQPANSATQ